MIEHQIKVKLIVANRLRHLFTHFSKSRSQLKQEIYNMSNRSRSISRAYCLAYYICAKVRSRTVGIHFMLHSESLPP